MSASSLRVAVAIILAASLATAPAAAASTAKEAIKEATAAAQKWQPDAVLTHVSTIKGRGDGTADQWLYTYYAPKAKKSAIITAKGKQVEVEPDVRNTSIDPLGTDFLDSDKAAEAAAKASGTWDKLEQVFEDRVARSLSSLGVPTKKDIESLSKRVTELTEVVQGLNGGKAKPAPRRRAAK